MRNTEELLKNYVRSFNETDVERNPLTIPNEKVEEWMLDNVPRIAVPDEDIERTYYFRWWTYRKHIRKTEDGYVVTEFLPKVNWAGKHNTIPCACGHHVNEGRWLRDTGFLKDYISFWYGSGKDAAHKYSNWLESAILSMTDVTGEEDFGVSHLSDMADSYRRWEETHGCGNLFWSSDNRDGAEYSITGSGLRPTLNSYQAANARAIAHFAAKAGEKVLEKEFTAKTEALEKAVNERLWDEELGFYRGIPQRTRDDAPFDAENRRARELFGYIPFLFGIAPKERAGVFAKLLDESCFLGEKGLSFADRSNPNYGIFYTGKELNDWLRARNDPETGEKGHECLWNGPTWPYATALALTALAKTLDKNIPCGVTKDDFVKLLTQYAASHVLCENGKTVPWIDENMHPDTGDWIARTRLKEWTDGDWDASKGGIERGKDYNHSTFCNLVLEGLFGIRPNDKELRVSPLFPKEWDYAKAENLCVHGHEIGISWERAIGKYEIVLDGRTVFASGEPVSHTLLFSGCVN